MDKDENFKVTFSPQVLDQLSKMSEEDRASIMEGLGPAIEKIKENPYEADPMFGGPLVWLNTRIKRYHRRFQLWRRKRNA